VCAEFVVHAIIPAPFACVFDARASGSEFHVTEHREAAGYEIAEIESMAFKKLLCPIDFSLGSQQALSVATRIARETGAELVIAHAWYLPAQASHGEYPLPDHMIQRMLDEAQRVMDDTTKRIVELGLPRVTSRLLRGVPWDQITRAAQADPWIAIRSSAG